ncbi:hypothetical protein IWQ61_003589 [Dispira simplex]|nr:hypothetical protein IWQ61_003589 [Dispira simplex]
MSNNIKVICRFRPQNSIENRNGGVPIIEIDENGESVKVNAKEFQGAFTFDRIFGMGTTQEELFNYSIRSTVEDLFNGYNGTVFAYGQTGSGKTFTMMGADIDNDNLKGIIPRIVETIFASIVDSPPTMEYTVKVSYMEIYMEKIRDLLNPQNDNLPIHEEKSRGVYVKGLCEVYVSSIEEVYQVMKQGGDSRVVAYTNMNAESSRSHSIFVITITQKNLGDGKVKVGRLYLVDLAGSEKVGKTGASGQTLEEAKKINKSLSALGMVINALTDGKSSHIPYRDSKLTRILQESLGGNSRTTLIINCSPSSYNDAETVGTLRFGMRAKTIKNKAKVNQDLSPAELKKLLKAAKTREVTFQAYVGALEGEVKIWRSGGTVPPEEYASLAKISGGKALGPPPSTTPSVPPTSPTPSSTTTGSMTLVPSTPTSPSIFARNSRAVTPANLDSLVSDEFRPMTPAANLADDEREEFLKRENELTDQLAEKESELAHILKQMEQTTDEINFFKEESTALSIENKEINQNFQQVRIELDRSHHAYKEAQITLESYKLSNSELTKKIEELKRQLAELHQSRAAGDGVPDKQRLKQERMAKMMAEIDPSGVLSKEDGQLHEALASLSVNPATNGVTDGSGLTDPTILQTQLANKSTELGELQQVIDRLRTENQTLSQKCTDLESRFTGLELEYEELLDRTIAEEEATADFDIAETIQELKNRLEAQYSSKRDQLARELEAARTDRDLKAQENSTLQASIVELKQVIQELKAKVADLRTRSVSTQDLPPDAANLAQRERDIEVLKKSMMNKLKEFDVMRKAMMRDLQIRCEKIIELEVALDETRDENNILRRKSIHSVQQQKTAILEKNIAQLMSIQKELVDQNTNLKKECAMADRKLAARNERIESLESLLLDTQEKMATQRQKYEAQLQVLKDKLGQSRNPKPAQPMGMMGAFGFGRIAKPLRGGGGGSATLVGEDELDSLPSTPTMRGNGGRTQLTNTTPNKRTSWLNWSR